MCVIIGEKKGSKFMHIDNNLNNFKNQILLQNIQHYFRKFVIIKKGKI